MRAVDNSPDGEMANEAVIEFKSNFADSLSTFNLFDGRRGEMAQALPSE